MHAHLPHIRPRTMTSHAERTTYKKLLSRIFTPWSPPIFTQPSTQPSYNYLVILCRLSRKECTFLEQDPLHLRTRISIPLLSSSDSSERCPIHWGLLVCLQRLRSGSAFCRKPTAETGTASNYICAYICAHASAHLVDQPKTASGDGEIVPIFSVRSHVGQVVRAVILSCHRFPTLSTPLLFGRVIQATQPPGSASWAMHLLIFANCDRHCS